MAQIREVRLVDDLTGEVADETIEFGLDGKNFEIDLSTANGKKLREMLAEYVAAGRKKVQTRARAGVAPRGGTRPATDREQNQAMRAFAREHGMKCNDRGRIPMNVQEAYHQATKGPTERVLHESTMQGFRDEVRATSSPDLQGKHTKARCEDRETCPEHGEQDKPAQTPVERAAEEIASAVTELEADLTHQARSEGAKRGAAARAASETAQTDTAPAETAGDATEQAPEGEDQAPTDEASQETDPRADWTDDERAAVAWHEARGTEITYRQDRHPHAAWVRSWQKWQREQAKAS